jgi:catechol 2,3-dioxygenase-like lactoylglutathione lyase family enzyme
MLGGVALAHFSEKQALANARADIRFPKEDATKDRIWSAVRHGRCGFIVNLNESALVGHRSKTQGRLTMKTLMPALCLISALLTGAASAQPYAPNQEGVTMGHWHLNSRDIEANRKIFLALGGRDTSAGGPLQRVTFPGVMVILNLGGQAAPATAGTAGSVINHVGLTVKNVQDSVGKWRAAGVPVEMGNNRTDQAWVTTPDGLRVEILENRNQPLPIQSDHVHFFQPDAVIPQSQAWYAKIFGAKMGTRNNAPVADLPGTQLRFNKVEALGAPTKGRILDHIGFDVTDLQGFLKKLEANGIRLDRPYTKNEQNGVALAFITDPWGTYIELNERPSPAYLN